MTERKASLTTFSTSVMILVERLNRALTWFGRALPRPTKQNRKISLVIPMCKFDGAGVQARERVLCTHARYQT